MLSRWWISKLNFIILYYISFQESIKIAPNHSHKAGGDVENDQLVQSGREDEAKKLKDEVNLLHKKLNVADQELQAADVLRRDLEGSFLCAWYVVLWIAQLYSYSTCIF